MIFLLVNALSHHFGSFDCYVRNSSSLSVRLTDPMYHKHRTCFGALSYLSCATSDSHKSGRDREPIKENANQFTAWFDTMTSYLFGNCLFACFAYLVQLTSDCSR